MSLPFNEFFDVFELMADNARIELDNVYVRYNALLSDKKRMEEEDDNIEFDNESDTLLYKNVKKLIDFRIYEAKLEILLLKNWLNKNRDAFIKVLEKIKETTHKFIDFYQEGVNDGSFTEQEYLEICKTSMNVYNTFSKIVYNK